MLIEIWYAIVEINVYSLILLEGQLSSEIECDCDLQRRCSHSEGGRSASRKVIISVTCTIII